MAERLPPTSLMGEWSIEVRRESACLIGTGYANHLVNNGAEPRHTPRMLRGAAGSTAFAIPAEDVGKVVAALDQVLGHPGYAKYSADHPPRTRLWTTPGFHDDLIPLHGPVILLGSRIPWAVTDSVELPYDTVADLRDRIATFASPASPSPGRVVRRVGGNPDMEEPCAQRSAMRVCSERGRLATERYLAARRAFEKNMGESRRLLELGARRRAGIHQSSTKNNARVRPSIAEAG